MKKLFLLLALLSFVFTACEGGESIEEANGGAPFVPEITISPDELSFPVEGGEQEVAITANFEYKVSEKADWLSVEQTETGLLVKVDKSERVESRYADIVLTNKEYEVEKFISVSQAAFEPSITIKPSAATFSANGGKQEIIITSNVEYEVSKKADWLSVEQTETGLLVTAKESKTTSERSAYISIINEKYSITKTIDIVQEAWVPKIELAQQRVEVEFEPAEYEVAVTSPFSWEATTKNEWIVVESETGIAGEEKLKFTTLRNEEEKERKGTITLKNSDYNLVAELYVTQKAFVPAITIEPETLTFAVEGGTQEIAITANFEYEYSTNADWLTIEKSEKGVNITATPNTKFEERTAEITISRDKYGISETISVTQKGISAESQNVILYTSSDGKIVKPYKSDVFGANIVSNTYKYGQGIIIFNAPITSIGDSAFEGRTSLTSITIPDSVTEIGHDAFSNCTSLTSVTIGNSVISIGYGAFEYCTSLTSITIPDSVTSIGGGAFSGCTSLTSVTIPDSVTSIGGGAFRDCTSLTSVTIGYSVTSIGEYAFYKCTSLTSITIPDSVTSIGKSAFSDCTSLTSVTIPDSVTSIGYWAFSGCTSLTNTYVNITDLAAYAISNTMHNIGGNKHLLVNSTEITELVVPDSVTTIGDYAFRGCTSLTSITIPDSVTSIGYWAFSGCTSLTDTYVNITDLAAYATNNPMGQIGGNKHLLVNSTEITELVIPDSVTSIGEHAFNGCTSLTSITIPDSVTSIGGCAFEGCISELIINSKIVETNYTYDNSPASSNNGWLYNAKFTKVTIGNSVTEIGNFAFSRCTSLTSVTIPDSVTSIGGEAFRYCTSLTSVTIPDSVTSIGGYAFYNCTSLTSVTIPDSVTSIGGEAFRDCTSLTSVDISDLSAWCKISFGSYNANPLYYAKKLYLNGSKLTDITIPSDITEIKDYAFNYCTSLTSITIPDSVTSIGDDAFKGCTGELTVNCNIPSRAFYGSKFTKVTIDNSVTSVGDDAFSDCTSLTSVTIPDSVTSIGYWAFSGCTSLTNTYVNITDLAAYAISNTMHNIGGNKHLLVNSTEITELVVPDSVTTIGDYAFRGCTSLTSVTIPDSVTSIGGYAFYNCTSLTSVTIPDSVTSIGGEAFRDCTSLTSVDISDLSAWCKISFGSYNANPLYYAKKLYLNGSKLTDITIPSDITEIKDYAFNYCTSLTSITIPDSVTSIGDLAFYNCTSLKEVYCRPTTPPTVGDYMFLYYYSNSSGYPEYKPIGCKIYVPRNSVEAYKTVSGWNSYASSIVGYDF